MTTEVMEAPSAPEQARPSPDEIMRKLAELRGMAPDELEAALDANAARFVEALA